MHRGYGSILGPVDSAFYYVEREQTPMNIGAVALYDGDIDYHALVKWIKSRLHLAERYQQRVVQAPFTMTQPTWINDPDFCIENHIFKTTLSAPGTQAQLRALVDRLLSRTLDRTKPLWEMYVIYGLKNYTAIFFQVHHCMVDGLAAVDLFTMMMGFDADIPTVEHQPLFDPPRLPDTFQLTLDSLQRDLVHKFVMVQKLGNETLRLASNMFENSQRLRMLVAGAHLINGNLRPIRKLPINGTNSGDQTLVWGEFSLDEVHAIRKTVGSSVNDVMLAVLTLAVEAYCHRTGRIEQPFLRVLMPVNIRSEEEKGDFGNRISVLPVDIPFGITDPLERLKTVTKFSLVMKESSLSLTMDMVLTLPSLIPAVAQPMIWGLAPTVFSLLAHTWCTNVAAPPMPVYLLGHELRHVYGFFPLNPTMGLAAVVVSYNGRVTLTLVIDRGIIADAAALESDLRNAYTELRCAANIPAVETAAVKEPVREISQVECTPEREQQPEPEPEPWSAVVETVTVVAPPESNGVAPAVVAAPAKVTMTEMAPPYKLFSEAWAKVFREIINRSEDYRHYGANWTAGSLAFVMNTAPKYGFITPSAVYLDLYRGICRAAHVISEGEATRQADFIIAGDYERWMEVLNGGASPLMMLTTGRLHLKKGALLKLLPHTRSATELVNCARRVPWC